MSLPTAGPSAPILPTAPIRTRTGPFQVCALVADELLAVPGLLCAGKGDQLAGGGELAEKQLEQSGVALVRADPATRADADRFLQLTSTPSLGYVLMVMVTAWGQRPEHPRRRGHDQ